MKSYLRTVLVLTLSLSAMSAAYTTSTADEAESFTVLVHPARAALEEGACFTSWSSNGYQEVDTASCVTWGIPFKGSCRSTDCGGENACKFWIEADVTWNGAAECCNAADHEMRAWGSTGAACNSRTGTGAKVLTRNVTESDFVSLDVASFECETSGDTDSEVEIRVGCMHEDDPMTKRPTTAQLVAQLYHEGTCKECTGG